MGLKQPELTPVFLNDRQCALENLRSAAVIDPQPDSTQTAHVFLQAFKAAGV